MADKGLTAKKFATWICASNALSRAAAAVGKTRAPEFILELLRGHFWPWGSLGMGVASHRSAQAGNGALVKFQNWLIVGAAIAVSATASLKWPVSMRLIDTLFFGCFFSLIGPYALVRPQAVRNRLMRLKMLDPDVPLWRLKVVAIPVTLLGLALIWRTEIFKL